MAILSGQHFEIETTASWLSTKHSFFQALYSRKQEKRRKTLGERSGFFSAPLGNSLFFNGRKGFFHRTIAGVFSSKPCD
jgi:hypothetical protein